MDQVKLNHNYKKKNEFFLYSLAFLTPTQGMMNNLGS
jgi:hypothetical protein